MLQKLFSPSRTETGDLTREARHYATLLSAKLEQLDVCYRYRRSEKDMFERGVQRVKFNLAVTQDDAIWLRIDTSPKKFPRGVSLAHIDNGSVLNDLSIAAERPVKFRKGTDGAWLVIERSEGIFGIKQINFNEVDRHYPAKSMKQLNVPLGLTYNRRIVYRSLAEFPHALVGGATGSGKTTFMHGWICSLIQHNRPDDLRLALIDLKGGTEFTRYRKLPHLLENAFVKDEGDVIWLLANLEGEMRRRLELFEAHGGVQNLNQWNVRASTSPRYEHLPRIVLFVDELSAVMLRPNLRKDAIRLFTTLGERGRAPGLHLALATQRPIVRVVDGQIKGNLEARFCFRVTDDTSSMVILDSIDASRFPESTPRGRYIYRSGLDRMELQAALITPYQIKEIVHAVETGDVTGAHEAAAIAPEEVFKMALTLAGSFAIQKLYKAFDGAVSRGYIERLGREYENEVIELEGVTYQLLPAQDFQARRLVPTAELSALIGSDVQKTDQVGYSGMQKDSETPSETLERPALPAPEKTTAEPGAEWLAWALANSRGHLSAKKIQAALAPAWSVADVARWLDSWPTGGQICIDNRVYTIQAGRGNLPRRIVKEER